VVTGIEALGRGQDLTKLDVFIAGAMQTFGPETLGQYIDIRDYLERRATALGLPMRGLVKTEEQIQQEMQQAQMQGMVQQFGPQVLDMAQKNAEAPIPEEG
jgi:site-specific recombinase XerC